MARKVTGSYSLAQWKTSANLHEQENSRKSSSRTVLPIRFSGSVSSMNKTPVKNNPQVEVFKEEPPGNRHRIERFDIQLEDLRSRFESPAAGGKKVRPGLTRIRNASYLYSY